jgi:ferredoxin
MSDPVFKDPQKPSGPIQVKNLVITVDRDLCIGTTQCVETAGKAFALDAQGVSSILATADEEDEKTIIEAAQGCPMNAISIKDMDGAPVYPK